MTRNQLISLFVVATLSGSATAWGQTNSQSGVAFFLDDQETTVWSPWASFEVTLPGNQLELGAAWVADVITSASVDVVTAATPEMNDLRNQFGLRVGKESVFSDIDIHGSLDYSRELDADAAIGQIGLARGFDQDNFELAVSYGLVLNRMGVRGEPAANWRDAWIHSTEIGLVNSLDRSTFIEFVYSGFWSSGYHSNPYRRVPILEGPSLIGAQWVEESAPNTRWRNAFTARVRRVFGHIWSTALAYRLYVDDWGVVSHTVFADAAVELAAVLSVGLRFRTSLQSQADFYRAQYEERLQFRTRDRRLSDHESGMAGIWLMWRVDPFDPVVIVRASVDGTAWQFDDFLGAELTTTSGANLRSLGWVMGIVSTLTVELNL